MMVKSDKRCDGMCVLFHAIDINVVNLLFNSVFLKSRYVCT
jgi:hypothetical protein